MVFGSSVVCEAAQAVAVGEIAFVVEGVKLVGYSDAGVTQNLADGPQVKPVLQRSTRPGVAQAVRIGPARDAALDGQAAE